MGAKRRSAFWQAIIGTVLGGLVLAGLLAVIGVLGRLRFDQILFITLLLGCAAILLLGAVLAIGVLRDRKLTDDWRADVNARLTRIEARLEKHGSRLTEIELHPLLEAAEEAGMSGRVLPTGEVELRMQGDPAASDERKAAQDPR
jgi:hypothetical protein